MTILPKFNFVYQNSRLQFMDELRTAFPQFDPELVQVLLKVGHVTSFAEGEVLMRQGQYIKQSLLVLDGKVKVYREGDEGEEFFLYYLEKGNACALTMMCAVKNETSQIKAKTVSPVKALLIPLSYLDNLLKEHRSWYQFVIGTYRSRFEEMLLVIDQIAFHAMDEKLEFYLRRQFDSFRTKTISITHQEIADDLNSSREVVSRLLKKLEADGRVTISRNEITNVAL